jgi:hypothetical protein
VSGAHCVPLEGGDSVIRMRNRFCSLMGIDIPIVLAPFGPWEQVEAAAAVSNAGGLGSVGTAVRGVQELRRQWARLAGLTDKPFAINHTGRPFDEDVFAAILDAAPAAISFHMGIDRRLIDRAHDVGALWLQQVGDVRSAAMALDAGADVLVAQGWEAGGTAGGSRPSSWFRRSSTPWGTFRCSPRAASLTGAGWLPPWFWAHRAVSSGRAFSPRPRCRSIRRGSNASSRPTRSTP